MADNESVTDYLIRAENNITALRDAGETMSDGLTIAMVLRGLPDSFKPHNTKRGQCHVHRLQKKTAGL